MTRAMQPTPGAPVAWTLHQGMRPPPWLDRFPAGIQNAVSMAHRHSEAAHEKSHPTGHRVIRWRMFRVRWLRQRHKGDRQGRRRRHWSSGSPCLGIRQAPSQHRAGRESRERGWQRSIPAAWNKSVDRPCSAQALSSLRNCSGILSKQLCDQGPLGGVLLEGRVERPLPRRPLRMRPLGGEAARGSGLHLCCGRRAQMWHSTAQERHACGEMARLGEPREVKPDRFCDERGEGSV